MAKYNKRISHKEINIERKEDGRSVTQTREKTFNIAIEQDTFYMSYVENMAGFWNLTSATDMKLLAFLCTKAEFNTGKVILSRVLRESLCDQLKIHSTQISRSLRSLRQKELIVVNLDEIDINPTVFWKGSNDARNKLLREDGLAVKIKFMYPKQEDDDKL